LVVTGASGRIGTFYRRWLHEGGQVGPGDRQWTLRLVDYEPQDDAFADQSDWSVAPGPTGPRTVGA
jgi:hypothetical protein